MSTFGQLYRQARAILQERTAESIRTKRIDTRLSQEIDELKRIMAGLLQAYIDAGGNKAE